MPRLGWLALLGSLSATAWSFEAARAQVGEHAGGPAPSAVSSALPGAKPNAKPDTRWQVPEATAASQPKTGEPTCSPECRLVRRFEGFGDETFARSEPQVLVDVMRRAKPWFDRDYQAPFADSPYRAPDVGSWEIWESLRVRVFVRWFPAVLHTAGDAASFGLPRRAVHLRGAVQWLELDGRTQPFTWPAPLAVAIARRPGEPLDPTRWLSVRDAELVPTVAATDGSFEVHVDAFELERAPGESRNFAVGLVLPMLEPNGAWESWHRVLPNTRAELAIDGPPRLDSELQGLNAVAGPRADHFDPVALVRAANRLRGLGEARAKRRLREYVALTDFQDQRPPPVAENLDFGDARSALFTCLAAFEPRAGSSYPSFTSGLIAYEPPAAATAGDPRYPLLLLDGLPFLCGTWISGRIGPPDRPAFDLERLLDACQLASEDLVPTDDPLGAVERVFDRLARPRGDFSRFGNLALDNDLRGQVWRALSPLVGPPPERVPPFGRRSFGWAADEPITDGEWRELKARVHALGGVHWDAAEQRYAAGPRK